MSYNLGASKKGFVFSLEAMISLLLFALILFSLPQKEAFSLKELTITQQENDLLRVWSAKESSEQEMIFDIQQMFGENAELWINDKPLIQTQKNQN